TSRVARTLAGQDVLVRILVVKNEGHRHLNILRKTSTGRNTFLSNNHCLPMLAEVVLEDIVFGVFPKAYGSLELAFESWTKNSVGDILDMLLQALEALCFIHNLGIAHRDAFIDNFLIQWNPESLCTMKISPSRPRVYLIDFEFAIEFPDNTLPSECVSIGYPLDDVVQSQDNLGYGRPIPPEVDSGHPYNPFKLDIWQLGDGLREFKTTIASIDEVLESFICENPNDRMNATEALHKLQSVVHSMTPLSLLIPFPEI
ncbi:kinase-like domain-containing protein, partial [Crucibulum laeve]